MSSQSNDSSVSWRNVVGKP